MSHTLPRLPATFDSRRPSIIAVIVIAGCLSFSVGLAGCTDSHETKGEKGTNTNTDKAEPDKPVPKPSVRTKLQTFRPLIAEPARAELSLGGVLIDFGSADQHKYTRGGWATGWGDNKNENGITYAPLKGSRSNFSTYVQTPVREIVIRARSKVSGQKATVWVDNTALATIEIGNSWSIGRVAVKEGSFDAGRHKVKIRFSRKGDPRGEIDWIWLAEQAGADPPNPLPRVMPILVGKVPKRSLIAPTSRSYSFYLQVPDKASLVFDHGSNVGAKFSVFAEVDGTETKQLFSGDAGDAWAEAVVDLSALANKAIRLELRTEGKEGVTGWGEPEIMVEQPQQMPKLSGKSARSAIVILIDTVRADMFKHFDPNNGVETPAYDSFADKSTIFLNAYNNENWTKPSVATTLSGTYPSTHDTKTDGDKLPKEIELISERLQDEKFATAGFVANGYVSGKFGFEKGWDVFKNYIRLNKPSEAKGVYADALEWLTKNSFANNDKRFFLFIQTIDPHVVYRVDREYSKKYHPADYKGRLGPTVDGNELHDISKGKIKITDKDVAWIKALYRGEVTYHDEHMGIFLEDIEELGLFEDTLIVITNDHGEEHRDHGRFGHGHSLYEELLRAPLLFHYPAMFPTGHQFKEVVENVDLSPTVMEVLGLEKLKGADGLSLMPLVQGRPPSRPYYAISAFLETRRVVRVGDWKLEVSQGNLERLFNVVSDPHEKTDKSGISNVAQRMCEVYLGEGLATPDKTQRAQDITVKRQFKAGKANIDPETRRQLEALGYFGD